MHVPVVSRSVPTHALGVRFQLSRGECSLDYLFTDLYQQRLKVEMSWQLHVQHEHVGKTLVCTVQGLASKCNPFYQVLDRHSCNA